MTERAPTPESLNLPPDWRIAVLTGAGISAESGIPTYRGKDGLWTTGSRDYRPQDLATLRAFQAMPRDIWHWYFYRRCGCLKARPNAGHAALADLARRLGPDRFTLVTQNVDGLHLRSGIDPDAMIEIHGSLHRMRCTLPCGPEHFPLGDDQVLADRTEPLTDDAWSRLKCPRCGAMARPHVLWFDECYDENLYRSETALDRVANAHLLLVVGTSGATTLPLMMVRTALRRNLAVIEVNPEASAFTPAVRAHDRGVWLEENASTCLPRLAQALAPVAEKRPATPSRAVRP
ncbi:SIR2 family NAD-dependent protein deacylase [Elongatibacter sediminis]|uniref:protein acetyllysine N-acetyltransferase n=1 Tax=Elongatibacter sediminis TaxID=3119006 RepID=A0AAW9RGY9_9GAMM